jgi:hypothetical protein
MSKQTWKRKDKDRQRENSYPRHFAQKNLKDGKNTKPSLDFHALAETSGRRTLQPCRDVCRNRCRASIIARSKEAPSPIRFFEWMNTPAASSEAHVTVAYLWRVLVDRFAI